MFGRRHAVAAADSRSGGGAVSERLRVNPIKCTAHGMCAELLPEFIALDPWGYPIIPEEPVPDELSGLAAKTVAVCPALALMISKSTAERR
jgi:ferredoxin